MRNRIYKSEVALFSECMPWCARGVLDIADIVREAILRQSKPRFSNVGVAYGVIVSGDLRYKDGSRDP